MKMAYKRISVTWRKRNGTKISKITMAAWRSAALAYQRRKRGWQRGISAGNRQQWRQQLANVSAALKISVKRRKARRRKAAKYWRRLEELAAKRRKYVSGGGSVMALAGPRRHLNGGWLAAAAAKENIGGVSMHQYVGGGRPRRTVNQSSAGWRMAALASASAVNTQRRRRRSWRGMAGSYGGVARSGLSSAAAAAASAAKASRINVRVAAWQRSARFSVSGSVAAGGSVSGVSAWRVWRHRSRGGGIISVGGIAAAYGVAAAWRNKLHHQLAKYAHLVS